MKIAVVNFMKVSPGSTVASNRIADFILHQSERALGVEASLVDRKELCKPLHYDLIFIVNGPYLYCNFKKELEELCRVNDTFVWVGNDYAITIPSQLKMIVNKNFQVWAAYDNFKDYKNHELINWNQLTFVPKLNAKKAAIDGVAYYGAYRKGRDGYFKKYLATNLYPVSVSTSKSNVKKFLELNPRINFFQMRDVIHEFGIYAATIYIEDAKTHKLYCSPANRFYECLSAGTLQLFDVSTANTWRRAGIDVGRWIVNGPEDVEYFLNKRDDFLIEQRAALYDGKNYVGDLAAHFNELIAKCATAHAMRSR